MFVRVVVTPGARKEKLEHPAEATFHISVREPASGNHANTRVRELLGDYFKVPVTKVRILTGHHSHSKLLSVDS